MITEDYINFEKYMTTEEKAKEFDRAIMRAKEIDMNEYGDIVTHILPSFKEIEEQEKWEQILSYIPDDALTDWVKKQIEKHKETVRKLESYQKMYFDENKQPLWDIKCAVRGDILVSDYGYDKPWMGMFKSFNDDKSFNVYCFLSGLSHRFIVSHDSYTSCTYKVRPATDKEKLYFISKMIENDYVWDDKKKDLKKIENDCCKKFND